MQTYWVTTSDNQNIEIKIIGIQEHDSLNGKERLLFDVNLVTDIISCLDTNSAHNISKIKHMGAQRYKNLDNKTTDKLENAFLKTKRPPPAIVGLRSEWDVRKCLSNSKKLGSSIFNFILSHDLYLRQIKLEHENFLD